MKLVRIATLSLVLLGGVASLIPVFGKQKPVKGDGGVPICITFPICPAP